MDFAALGDGSSSLRLLIMPLIVLVLLMLPIRLQVRQMYQLAFFLWVLGGVILILSGIYALQAVNPPLESFVLVPGIILALGVGFGKGKFVLAKTSHKNIDRISAFTEPQRPIHVYSVKSWVTIGLMILISLSLTWFDAPMEWRGFVRLAVGFALVMSSLAYLKTTKAVVSA